jgi:hypothetical protein
VREKESPTDSLKSEIALQFPNLKVSHFNAGRIQKLKTSAFPVYRCEAICCESHYGIQMDPRGDVSGVFVICN